MDAKHEIKGLRQSFQYAFSGFLYCINNERNMRIHLSAFVLLSMFSYYYGLDRTEFMIFTIVCSIVVFAEMVNTSIEAIVNLASPSYHRLAKIAKDIAAGAVFVTAMAAVIVGVFLFGDFVKLSKVFWMFWEKPYRFVLMTGLTVLLLFFVFCGGGIVSKAAYKLEKKKK